MKSKLFLLILLSLLFCNGWSQQDVNPVKRGKFTILEIDSTSLNHYYWISLCTRKCLVFKKEVTLLSLKNTPQIDIKKTSPLIVGEKYYFQLYTMGQFLYDVRPEDEPDSVYWHPFGRNQIIKISEKVLFSVPDDIYPYSSPNVEGLYYISEVREE